MEISKRDMSMLKGMAILFMLLLHLFCRKEVGDLYEVSATVNGVPLIYYIGLFGDVCVPIYCFASGYGLFVSFSKKQGLGFKSNILRIFKLLVNFWIILLMFVSIGFFMGMAEEFPGSMSEFILNFFLLSSSYNGAWWFLQTYVILVFLAPVLFKLVKKHSSLLLLLASGLFYLVSYIQRIKGVLNLEDQVVLSMTVNAVVLFGTSQLPFIVGAIFAKEKIYSRFYHMFHNIALKNTFCILGIVALEVFHAFFESLIIAPFNAIVFICLFTIMDKTPFVERALLYLSKHSTNIWLVHMFFYMSIFPELTFAPKYPILIFIWLLLLCLASSYLIHLLYNPTLGFFNKVFPSDIKRRKNAA